MNFFKWRQQLNTYDSNDIVKKNVWISETFLKTWRERVFDHLIEIHFVTDPRTSPSTTGMWTKRYMITFEQEKSQWGQRKIEDTEKCDVRSRQSFTFWWRLLIQELSDRVERTSSTNLWHINIYLLVFEYLAKVSHVVKIYTTISRLDHLYYSTNRVLDQGHILVSFFQTRYDDSVHEYLSDIPQFDVLSVKSRHVHRHTSSYLSVVSTVSTVDQEFRNVILKWSSYGWFFFPTKHYSL